MNEIRIYGSEEIEERVNMLTDALDADFTIIRAGEMTEVIRLAYDNDLDLEFVNDAMEDELRDEYWNNDSYAVAERYVRS